MEGETEGQSRKKRKSPHRRRLETKEKIGFEFTLFRDVKMNHFYVVGQGGGMITAYHAGVVSALKKRFGFKKLHRIVASSGAAAVYSYLVSGQENLIQPIWEDLAATWKPRGFAPA